MQRVAQQNAVDCASAWGKEPPLVTVFDDLDKVPRERPCNPVMIVDGTEDPTTLGYHFVSPFWGPASRASLETASGILDGDESLCETVCHEVLEILCDPFVNLWMDGPAPSYLEPGEDWGDGWQYALEVCDAVQTTYPVKLWGLTGVSEAKAANFVTPAWFDSVMAQNQGAIDTWRATGRGFDHAGQLKRPFAIGPHGYAPVRNLRTKKVTPRYFSARWSGHVAQRPRVLPEAKLKTKRHPWARSARRGTEW